MTNKNKLNLEQILEVVKEKFVEAYIEDTRIYLYKETDESYLYIKDNKIVYQPDETARFNWEEFEFDDIIQLKHYLNIPLLWKDLVKWAKQQIHTKACCFNNITFRYTYPLFFTEEGNIIFDNYDENTYNSVFTCDYSDNSKIIATNRSYWNMYQIIKNLVEN